MAQYTFSTSDSQLLQDIKEENARIGSGFSFSQTVEFLLQYAVKERKRQRSKNAKKGNIKDNPTNSR